MTRPAGTSACLAASVLVTCAVALAPAQAHAAKPRGDRVCAPTAKLYETPGGIQIGIVTGGRSVFVLKRTADGRWSRVRTTIQARGWLRTSQLCGGD